MNKTSHIRLLGILIIISILGTSLGLGQVTGDKISITVREVKLDRVLRILSEKSGMKFISDPAISSKSITLDLKEVAPLEALSILTELYDLGFQQLSGGKYIVAPRSDIEVPTQIRSYSCQFAESRELAETVKSFITRDIGQIFADVRTNNVVIQDTPGKLGEIFKLLESLDKPTKQVYIKSAIVEISKLADHERGLQWYQEESLPGRDGYKVGTDFGYRENIFSEPLDQVVFPTITGGFGLGIVTEPIEVLLGMLSKSNDLNLLSTPYLMTLDNKSADIEVGDQIPYPKLNEFGMVSYEFKNATVKLTVRAHVNNDSTITVRLEPQANFQQGITPDGIPIIATRRANTEVIVENGKTVVLGGLMQESDVKAEEKFPVLGSIPIIGELFKSTSTNKKKTELMVMLTPYIVDIYSNDMRQESMDKLPESFQQELKKRP